MKRIEKLLCALALLALPMFAIAAGADLGQVIKQETNWTAIAMFAVFVIAIYEVMQSKSISLTELASALGIVSGAGGASVMMKSKTEPGGE